MLGEFSEKSSESKQRLPSRSARLGAIHISDLTKRDVYQMKNNEHYEHIARELMRKRLGELDTKAANYNGRPLTAHELTERVQLQELLGPTWRDCPGCLGVGRVRFAYTAIITTNGYMIARADEDQPGHTPQDVFGIFPISDAAKAHAQRLNNDLGLDEQTAYRIVTSSMRAQGIRERHSQRENA